MERDIAVFANIIGQTIDIKFNGSDKDIPAWILAQLDILEQLQQIDQKLLNILNPKKRDIHTEDVSDWKILTLIDIKCTENLIVMAIRGLVTDTLPADITRVASTQKENLESSIKHLNNQFLREIDMEVVEDIEAEILEFVNSNWRENQINFPFCNQDDSSEWVKAQKEIVEKITEACKRMPDKTANVIRESLTSINDIISNIEQHELNPTLYRNARDQLDKVKKSIEEYKKSD
jgi:hypothetical protein